MKNLSKPNASQKRVLLVLWWEMKGIWKKKKEISQVMKITSEFPRRRNYSRGSGDILHFPKIKVGSCQNHPNKLETNEKPIKTERFPKMSSLEGNEGNMGEIMGNMTG